MKFSILIPAFKDLFLFDAIQSVLNQSFDNWELIVVDDCSPYPISEIVSRFVDPRIHFFRNALNCGAVHVVDNWNRCLHYSSGDYVICMGDDDLLDSHCLESYLCLIEKYPNAPLLHCRTSIIDSQSSTIQLTDIRPEWESVWDFIWYRWFGGRKQFIGDFCFRADLLKLAGGFVSFPYACASDDVSAVRAAALLGVAHTNFVGFFYRQHPSTITNTQNLSLVIKAKNSERCWYKSFFRQHRNQSHSERFQQLLLQQQQYWNREYHHCLVHILKFSPLRLIRWLLLAPFYHIPLPLLLQAFKHSKAYK